VILTFDRIGVRYPGADDFAVRDVSFTVSPGERVGLLGSSGSGKTTLLNVAAGLVTPTYGSLLRNSVALSTMSGSTRRASDAQVGMVHQQLNLTGSLWVVHNVNAGVLGQWSLARSLRSLWFGSLDQDKAREALDRLGIADKLKTRTADLSGGQQQRVALARVLRQQPKLLVADEPVSAVDPAWSDEVLSILSDEVATRHTSLLVSLHDVDLAKQFCDRLIGLRAGAIAFDLPTSQVSTEQITSLYSLDRIAASR
jgi:phosphonate transport system ATP-binding protein